MSRGATAKSLEGIVKVRVRATVRVRLRVRRYYRENVGPSPPLPPARGLIDLSIKMIYDLFGSHFPNNTLISNH